MLFNPHQAHGIRVLTTLSLVRVYYPLPPHRRAADVRVGRSPHFIRSHDVLVRICWPSPVGHRFTHVHASSTSDSIFLLGGIVNVVLFCTIRRVIPVKEVLVGILTGKAFRKRLDEPPDTTWCIGTMEAGEKNITDDVAIVASDDYFALRQPKFEIVNPPDQAVAATTPQTAQKVPTPRTNFVPADLPSVIPRSTKPLPTAPSIYSEDEGSDHGSSFSRQSSFRRLPPVPQGPRSAPLLPVSERRESPPPPYRPDSSQHRYSISGTHSHTGSFDSVISDTPLLGVNRPPEKK